VQAPLRQVGDARRHAFGVQAQAQHVDRRLQQLGRGAFHQQRHQRVVRDQVPVAVHCQRRKGLVAFQYQVDGAARGGHRGVVERALPVHRREAGGHQQRVALAQRHFQPLGQAQHHFAAGRGAAGFDVAQVAGRDLGLLRQVELAQAAVGAPVPQVRAERIAGAGLAGLGRVGAGGVHGPAFWRGGGAAP